MEVGIPYQVADLLRGRAFENFDAFRQAIWKAAASVPNLAREFSAPNRALMARGMAPKAPHTHQLPGSTIFHVWQVGNGNPYNVDNLRVISPLRYYQLLHYDGLPFQSGEWAIDTAGSKPKLTEIAKRLLGSEHLSQADESRLLEEFEGEAFYPYAADLIFNWPHEFETPEDLVDFALGLQKPKQVPRDELVRIARKLMAGDIENTVQSERLSMQFKASIPHPEGDGLIFYPKIDFKTPEELVDHALAYNSASS